ncbi:MAG: hypothetical protein AB9919_02210 [Geobacteraceae bacterium]
MREKRYFTRVEQPPGSRLCLACVVAMLTDTTLDEVMSRCELVNESTPLPFSAAVQYLAGHRWHVGLLLTGRFALGRLLVYLLLRRWYGAILIVRPPGAGSVHAVLWTGREILDPAPGCHGRSLRDYRILEWWPLVRTS